MILWFILVDVAIRLAQAMIATWYNHHDFSHFQHVIPFERVSFGFTLSAYLPGPLQGLVVLWWA